jgi:hypothetical protein
MADIEFVSLAELEQFEEQLTANFRADADANALMAPFPKGAYVVKLAFSEADPDKRWQRKMRAETNETYYLCGVTAEIADVPNNPAEYVGRKVFGNAMTLVTRGSGTTSAQAIIQAAGHGEKLLTMPATHQTQTKLINQIVGGEAICGMFSDWEANVYNKEKKETEFRLRGMNSFPKDKQGNPLPFAYDEKGQEVPARNIIRRWLTLAQVEELHAKEATAEDGGQDPDEGDANEEVAERMQQQAQQAPQPPQAPPAAPQAPKPPQARAAAPSAPQASAQTPGKPPVRRPVPTR